MAFEFDGEKYKQASSHQKEWGAKLISEFEFTGAERILDLGCGDGGITAQLAEQVPQGSVVGIDASKGMIETALANHRSENLRFELGDINEIRYRHEFDIVISNATLHWVKDHKRLLANVHAALREHGMARFNFAADGNCSHLFTVVKRAIALPRYASYFSSFAWPWYMPEIEAYRTVAGHSPFADVTVWGENADRFFPDAATMVQWIDQPSLVPFLKHIDEKDRQEFRDFVVEQMIEETIQPDSTCFETFRRVNLTAKK
jgi:trans-aconitate 2-methyltransferase